MRFALPPLQRRLDPRFKPTHSACRRVSAEIVEPVSLRESIKPLLFGNFGARQLLARSRRHRFELGHRRPADGGVARPVLDHQFSNEVRTLQDDASARRARGEFAEIG